MNPEFETIQPPKPISIKPSVPLYPTSKRGLLVVVAVVFIISITIFLFWVFERRKEGQSCRFFLAYPRCDSDPSLDLKCDSRKCKRDQPDTVAISIVTPASECTLDSDCKSLEKCVDGKCEKKSALDELLPEHPETDQDFISVGNNERKILTSNTTSSDSYVFDNLGDDDWSLIDESGASDVDLIRYIKSNCAFTDKEHLTLIGIEIGTDKIFKLRYANFAPTGDLTAAQTWEIIPPPPGSPDLTDIQSTSHNNKDGNILTLEDNGQLWVNGVHTYNNDWSVLEPSVTAFGLGQDGTLIIKKNNQLLLYDSSTKEYVDIVPTTILENASDVVKIRVFDSNNFGYLDTNDDIRLFNGSEFETINADKSIDFDLTKDNNGELAVVQIKDNSTRDVNIVTFV